MTPTQQADVHATVEGRLRAVGQRYTPKRRELVEALDRAPEPLSMPDIVSAHGLPQSTVYRNLVVLEQAGVARRVLTDGEFARFELTEDFTEHHHHLICSSCRRVEDVEVPPALERDIDRSLDRLAREAGFASVSHRLDLIGSCRACAAGGR